VHDLHHDRRAWGNAAMHLVQMRKTQSAPPFSLISPDVQRDASKFDMKNSQVFSFIKGILILYYVYICFAAIQFFFTLIN